MKTPRNVKRSFYTALATLFQDASTFGTAFNTYYESDLRDGVTPSRPALYILDTNIQFEVKHLPVIATWFRFSYRGLQLGGPALWHGEVSCEVYARNRGEREDIAAAIAEGIADEFVIYDYSGSSPTEWGVASVYEGPANEYWALDFGSVSDELAVEGTLLNWVSASSRFWCKPT